MSSDMRIGLAADVMLATALRPTLTWLRCRQALAALFMMNNVHYMVKAVEGSPALMLLGQEWLERHKVRLHEQDPLLTSGLQTPSVQTVFRAPTC